MRAAIKQSQSDLKWKKKLELSLQTTTTLKYEHSALQREGSEDQFVWWDLLA